MCGIAGIFDRSGAPVQAREIEAMTRLLQHRGPDDSGCQVFDGLGIGATRLSILDLSDAGHMPMVDEESGNWIVYNGEVYNYRDLPETLGLTGFTSRTDTEVVLKAYAKLGPRCLDHLNGIFAFAIWDARRKELFCARDRLGVKPFFFAWDGDRFCFASEAKALFAAGIPRRPNLGILYDYLSNGIYEHSTETFFGGINQLAPGHTLTIGHDGNKIECYWMIDPGREAHPELEFSTQGGFDQACADYADLAQDAIRLQLHADTPVAIHISGGLDSTFLMATVNKINGGQGSFKAFTQIYGNEKYDEKPHVDALARQIGWNVEAFDLDISEVTELADEAMWHHEMPFPGIITLCKQNLIKSSHHNGAKVILEGQGGDEIGAGYQYVMGPHFLDLLEQGRAKESLGEITGFAALNNLDDMEAVRKFTNGLAAYFQVGRSADGSISVRKNCLSSDFVTANAHDLAFPQPFRTHLLNMQYRDILHTKLPRILKACDRVSMGYGRELRVPFLDHRLVEFTFSLPASFKIQDGVQRRIMRETLKEFLPSDIANVPKRTVVNPQTDWLKGPLSDWVGDTIASTSFRQRGIFDAHKVKKNFEEFLAEKHSENSFFVWQWLIIEKWFRMFIDSDPLTNTS